MTVTLSDHMQIRLDDDEALPTIGKGLRAKGVSDRAEGTGRTGCNDDTGPRGQSSHKDNFIATPSNFGMTILHAWWTTPSDTTYVADDRRSLLSQQWRLGRHRCKP